ncbi:hypothetical protein AB1L30_04815 [Bremerella sp. JC817]|uniref:hypothetical protein n=1 Tax=Bremerella sp. JC817 TaxID=3231756 RepID=UPI0034596476
MPKRLKRRSDTIRRIGRDIYEVRRGSSSSQGYDADWERVAKHRRISGGSRWLQARRS